MSTPTQSSLSIRLLSASRYLIPVIVIGACLAAWYSDVISNALAHRPRAADIAGTWAIDEAEYARLADRAAQSVPDGELRKKYYASLLTNADPYRGVSYTFKPSGYSIKNAEGEHDFPATFEGFPPNSLAIRPTSGKPIAVMLDDETKHVVINLPIVGIPLKKIN